MKLFLMVKRHFRRWHPPHHRSNAIPPNRKALAAQQVTQHPAAGERVFEVQFASPQGRPPMPAGDGNKGCHD